MNRQIKPWYRLRLYNAKTLTVPLRNVSKLERKEDDLLNKPPNSMLSINFIP